MMVAAQARQNERQAEAMRDKGGGTPGPPRVDREFAVAYLMEHHGHTRASAEAAVDQAAREG